MAQRGKAEARMTRYWGTQKKEAVSSRRKSKCSIIFYARHPATLLISENVSLVEMLFIAGS